MSSFKESEAIEYSSDVLMGLQYAGWDYRENEKELYRSKLLRELLNIMEINSKSADEFGRLDTRVIQLKILKRSTEMAEKEMYFLNFCRSLITLDLRIR